MCWGEIGGTQSFEKRDGILCWSFWALGEEHVGGTIVWIYLSLETQVYGDFRLTSCVTFSSRVHQPGEEGQFSWHSIGVLSIDAAREGWSQGCNTNVAENFLSWSGKSLRGKMWHIGNWKKNLVLSDKPRELLWDKWVYKKEWCSWSLDSIRQRNGARKDARWGYSHGYGNGPKEYVGQEKTLVEKCKQNWSLANEQDQQGWRCGIARHNSLGGLSWHLENSNPTSRLCICGRSSLQ